MKNIFKIIFIITIFSIIWFIGSNWHKEQEIQAKDIENDVQIEENIEETVVEPIPYQWEETEKGYDVIAKLEIPKISLKTNVLSQYSEDALLVSVTKFWGANPNQVGNFCIAGHNYYKRTNMFYKLKNLKKGDEILLTDRNNLTIEYIVYDIFKVSPKDISCLSQETNGAREITLITCTSNSKQRIIVKAKEI